jgi:hypothetical protein
MATSGKFAAAVTAASSVIGPIIPPSGIMIIYAYVMGESVAALFLAGIVPGVLVGVGLMMVVAFLARRHDFPVAARKASWPERGQASLKAFFPLLTPVIILGGILGGVFTPTEASAVAAVYAFIVALFILKTMGWADLPKVLTKAAMTTSVVLLLVGAAMAFKTVVSLSHTPEILANFILGLSDNPLHSSVPDQRAAVHCRNVPRCGTGDHHSRADPGADLYRSGRASCALRHHHERQPHRRAGNAADGACAVRHVQCVGRAGGNHRQGNFAVPAGGSNRDLPDYLRATDLAVRAATVRIRAMRNWKPGGDVSDSLCLVDKDRDVVELVSYIRLVMNNDHQREALQ